MSHSSCLPTIDVLPSSQSEPFSFIPHFVLLFTNKNLKLDLPPGCGKITLAYSVHKGCGKVNYTILGSSQKTRLKNKVPTMQRTDN